MMFKLFRLSAYVNFAVAHLRENVVSGGLVEVASKHSVADAAIRLLRETKQSKLEARLKKLSDSYLQTVEMGLLGGLNHGAYVDPNRGGTADTVIRNQCMSRSPDGGIVDNCMLKWDGLERLERVRDVYDRVRREGIEGDLVEAGVWRGETLT